jgi:enamine deaminase RidA (YjgF/YER057c/UK114 family)
MIHNEQDSAADAYFSSSVLRRFAGPEANEVSLLCRPESLRPGDIVHQAESVYRTLRDLLRSEGGGLEHVVQETVYFRNIREDLNRFQQARLQVVKDSGLEAFGPASTFIEQPPLNDWARLEILVLAVIPHDQRAAKVWNVWRTSQCVCNDCARIGAQVQLLGGQKYLRAGNIYGASGTSYAETYNMFVSAEELLRQEGMGFQDVVRTWIYLREMDRDYAEFNRGRREFFQDRGIKLHPASTGIYGAPFPEGHNFLMGIYAIKSPDPLQVGLMTTPTLNEAWMYGSDFSRGLKVVEANKIALYVSGTASVDEAGETAHVGDFDGQVERMIVNVSTLLAAQNASLGDLVSATTYLKSPEDAPRLRRILRQRGLAGLPNALVKAAVCRPNLLCEMEAIAALPRPA